MDPLQHSQPDGLKTQGDKRPLFQVTKLSKYLAMVIFITLPFIGGWIGYSYGVSNQNPDVAANDAEPTLGNLSAPLFIAADISSFEELPYMESRKLSTTSVLHTKLSAFIFNEYSAEMTAGGGPNPYNPQPHINITRIAADSLFVESTFSTADDLAHSHNLLVRTDNATGEVQIVRELTEYQSDYYGMPLIWTQAPYEGSQAVLIRIESNDPSQQANSVVQYNFMTGEKKVLYTEADPNVSLAAICEAGCTGPLYATNSNILFCRYQKVPQSIDSKFIECREVALTK